MRDGEATEPGLVASSLTMLRLLVGWAGTALGALNLLMGTGDVPYVVFHLVLLAGGLLLLGIGLLPRRPRLPACLAGLVVTVLGLVISAVPRTSSAVCCLQEYPRRHGYPFTVLAGGLGHARLDLGRGIADLVFWAAAGLFVLIVLTLIVPAPKSPATPPPEPVTHAEHRAEVVDDENVGGLP